MNKENKEWFKDCQKNNIAFVEEGSHRLDLNANNVEIANRLPTAMDIDGIVMNKLGGYMITEIKTPSGENSVDEKKVRAGLDQFKKTFQYTVFTDLVKTMHKERDTTIGVYVLAERPWTNGIKAENTGVQFMWMIDGYWYYCPEILNYKEFNKFTKFYKDCPVDAIKWLDKNTVVYAMAGCKLDEFAYAEGLIDLDDLDPDCIYQLFEEDYDELWEDD